MTARRLPYGRQEISAEDVEAVVKCLQSDFLTQGPRIAEFEAALCHATSSPHAVVVSSGTAALHLAMLALDIGPGDVGITSPITFVASANALRYVGAQVVFSDVEADTGLLALDALERTVARLKAEGRPPRVIVPVDFAGQPTDLGRIRRIADSVGAFVVEDAAHSLGAEYRDGAPWHRVGSGAHADVTILSFHPVKHVTSGEGGALLIRDERVRARAAQLRSHGIHADAARFSRAEADPMVGPWYHEQELLGFHYRLTDVQCALGISQLRRLPDFLARRRALAAGYDRALAAPELAAHYRPLRQRHDARNAYHLYVVQLVARPGEPVTALAARRKRLYGFLREREIFAQVHYIPVHWQPFHRDPAARDEPFPEAVRYYAASLSLPLFPSLTEEDQTRVVATLREFAASEGG